MAEERRRLRELDEAEKEERRKKREEERLKQENEAAAVEGQQDASTAAAPATAERSFELPERLKEYKGDPEDEKALLAFRQEQQAEKRRLDKERSRWMGEQLRRQREEEALAKQAKEAELAKQREREAAEDALARAQEALEEKMEKLALRRAPLGLDRQYRRYWWGIGAHRPALYVEDAQGKWGVISSAEDLQALMASLDRRGVRELALAQAIEKKLDVMELAMRRAGMGAGAADKTRDKWTKEERPAPMRQSSRQSRQPEFFVPSADAGKPQSGGGSGVAKHAPSAALVALNMGVSELTSFEEAVDTLLSIQQGAAEADIEGPGPKGWTQWVTEVSWAGKGKVVRDGDDKATPAASAALLRNTLHIKAIELEACLAAASDEPERDDEETSDGEEGPSAAEGANGKGSRAGEETDADDGPRPSESLKVLESVDATFTSPAKLPKDIRQLWRTARERALWQADVGQAGTSARLAYLVAVLELQAAPLLRTLRRTVHGPTPVAVKKQAGSKKVKPAPGKATKKEEPFRERPEGARRCARHMTT